MQPESPLPSITLDPGPRLVQQPDRGRVLLVGGNILSMIPQRIIFFQLWIIFTRLKNESKNESLLISFVFFSFFSICVLCLPC